MRLFTVMGEEGLGVKNKEIFDFIFFLGRDCSPVTQQ